MIYSTDFTEYSLGSQPSDWTEIWDTSASSSSVVDTIGDDQALFHNISLANRNGLSWNDLDGDADRANTELLYLVYNQDVTSAAGGGGFVRGSGTSTSETGYAVVYENAELGIRKLVSATQSVLATTSGKNLAVNTWYWIRFRVNGSSLKAKIWAKADSEPGAWDLETTDTDITAAGKVGVCSFSAGNDPYYEAFAAATNGDTASFGGSAAALDGAASAQATATGTLTTQIPLTGAAAVVATATGALSTAIPLTGQAASVSIADGVLTTQISLDGSALAQASASGALTTQISLSGAALAEALASAGLTTSSGGLEGTAAAQATASGSLLTAIPLAGAAQAWATAEGGLTTIIQLSGAAASVSSATGSLLIETTLSGAALAQAQAAGELTTQIRLDAQALAQVAATGALTGGSAALLPVQSRFLLKAPGRLARLTAPSRQYRIAA